MPVEAPVMTIPPGPFGVEESIFDETLRRHPFS
jgi:hypothetical protein